jgi:hypothetical protein
MHFFKIFRVSILLLLLSTLAPAGGQSQQVVQRGQLGRPSQVFDETQQWTTPILLSSDHDVELYIPDVTSPDWLKLNYQTYQDKGQYVISMFTFYQTPKACRANQIGWGYGDSEHLDACNTDIGYRVRQALVDPNLKSVTLIMAAMVGPDGQIDPASIRRQPLVRRWAELDANTQTVLEKTTEIVAKQMKIYDIKVRNTR